MPLNLSKPIKPEVFEIDPHLHVFSNPRDRANTWWRDPGRRDLSFLLGKMDKAGINALALTRVGDDHLPERYINQVLDLPRGWGAYIDPHMVQAINPDGAPYTFLCSEELFTNKGHVLLLGMPFGTQLQRDGITLEEVKAYSESDPHVARISDHTFDRGGLGTTGALQDEEINEWIHAYEWNSLASLQANLMAVGRALLDPKPIVYSSDAHRPSLIGRGSTQFDPNDLDFRNGKSLTFSLREGILSDKARMGKTKQSPFWAKAHHAYMIALDHKLGFGKKDAETDSFEPGKPF